MYIGFGFSPSKPKVVSGGAVTDPDAEAFFTATGITDATQKSAVNDLVVNLKSANLWSKMKAVYPFVGGTSTTHKYNLKDPRDLDAAFRLTFATGFTHSSTGILPNGSSAYANTFLTPSTSLSLNSTHLSFYSRTNSSLINNYDIGSSSISGVAQYTLMVLCDSNVFYNAINVAQGNAASASNTDSRGLFIANRTASNVLTGFRNSTKILTSSNASSILPTASIFLSALNSNGSASFYSQKECAFASIGDGLTDTEAQVFNQIVEGYQFALSRNIDTAKSFYYNSSYSNETNAFLYSTQITDTTIQTATNTLVSDLKTAGIWSKMKAVYPMVGGTATTHKYNLVNPSDTNGAFRLTFSTGWTHSSNGATPNGTNAYANTFFSTSVLGSINSGHLSYYSRTNFVTAASNVDMGVLKSTPDSYTDLQLCGAVGNLFRFNNGTSFSSIASTNTQGYYLGTRTASNVIKTFKNGVVIISGTNLSSATSAYPVFLGATNNVGTGTTNTPQYYSTRQCAFASIGDGLSDAEAANFYTAVQAFQTTLNRNI